MRSVTSPCRLQQVLLHRIKPQCIRPMWYLVCFMFIFMSSYFHTHTSLNFLLIRKENLKKIKMMNKICILLPLMLVNKFLGQEPESFSPQC